MKGFQGDFAFISYRHVDKDREFVKKIEDYLKSYAIRIWRDTQIRPSERWREILQSKLDETKALILVWSHEASTSRDVQAEWEYVLSQNKPIYTVLTDATPLPYILNTMQWTGNIKDNEEQALEDLVADLRDRLGLKSWLEDFYFEVEIERYFAVFLTKFGVEWYYNVSPPNSNYRFLLPDFEESGNKLTRINVTSDNRRSSSFRKNLFDYVSTIWRVIAYEDGQELYKVMGFCHSCFNMSFVDEDEYYTGDPQMDASSDIFIEWCPKCQVQCEKCENYTSSETSVGGLCEACQIEFDERW